MLNIIENYRSYLKETHTSCYQNNLNHFQKNIECFKNSKELFKNKFSSLLKEIENVCDKNTEKYEWDEESPAAASKNKEYCFDDGEKLHIFSKGSTTNITISLERMLESDFEFNLRIVSIPSSFFIVMGVSSENYTQNPVSNSSYFCGNFAEKSFGIANNKSIGLNKKWLSDKLNSNLKDGDEVGFKGNNGVISYHVNNEWSQNEYDIGTDELYITFSAFTPDSNKNIEVEFV